LAQLVELDRLRVVLVSPRNPLNIGAAARAMSNFGFLRLRVVNPYDVAFREARSAMGAAPLLTGAEECASVADSVADCSLVVGTTSIQHRELLHPIRRLDEGAALIRQQLTSANVALLFGSEKFGLSNEELSHCHWLMRIPTREEHGSMNLGQAVAVSLYELVRGRKAASKTTTTKKKENASAKSADVERLTQVLFQVLRVSGYIEPRAVAAEEKLRRLVRRLELNADDAAVLTGMLRQTAWKLNADKKSDK
jgi:tRNA/rRNA methyltransferase